MIQAAAILTQSHRNVHTLTLSVPLVLFFPHTRVLTQDILEVSSVNISINQVEYHVGMKNSPANVTDSPSYDRKHGIFYESFEPLCGQCDDTSLITGNVTGNIGRAHGKTGAQVALRWLIQSGTAVIPRAGSAKYQAENLDIFDFELTSVEMETLNAYTKPSLAGVGGDCSVAVD